MMLSFADVDECNSATLNNCHQFAKCKNTVGSFNCTCEPGHIGDGISCVGTYTWW